MVHGTDFNRTSPVSLLQLADDGLTQPLFQQFRHFLLSQMSLTITFLFSFLLLCALGLSPVLMGQYSHLPTHGEREILTLSLQGEPCMSLAQDIEGVSLTLRD